MGILNFWQKPPNISKVVKKKGQNHQFALLYFTFHQKNPLFDVDPFFGPLTWNRPHININMDLPDRVRSLTNNNKQHYTHIPCIGKQKRVNQ